VKNFKIVLLLCFLFSNFSYASEPREDKNFIDKSCREVFLTSFNTLKTQTIEFNNGNVDKAGMASSLLKLDSYIASKRAICFFAESSNNKKCVKIYKKRYLALRNKLVVTDILLGSQTEVDSDFIETLLLEFETLYMKYKCADLE
jgi:hypothetical protein